MGVKGLSGLVDSNPHLLQRHFLHDTKVVIDGNNVAFRLYLETNIDCVFGGEYAKYAQQVRAYYELYRECNVETIVLLDGAYEPSNAKLKTIQDRSMQKIRKMKPLAQGSVDGIKIMPALATDVYRETLKELGIETVQCIYEADGHIARMANELGCPVISDDSDFFVYDLRGGLVRLSSINNYTTEVIIDSVPRKTLECKIFYVENLLSNLDGPMNRELLPLFGAIVGNDFVEKDTFENFFSHIKMPKSRSNRFHYNLQQTRIIGTLNFLSTHTNLRNCMDFVLKYVPSNKRPRLRQLMDDVMGRYKMENCSQESVVFKTGHPVPSWVVEEFTNGRLPSKILTMIVTGTLFQFLQIECLNFRSSYERTLQLRKNMYGIIFNGKANIVQELDRSGYGMRYTDVEFPNGPISLEDIPNLDASGSQQILKQCACVTTDVELSVISSPGKLLLYCLEYMVHNGEMDSLMVISLLVMHIVVQATAARRADERMSYLLGEDIGPHEVAMFDRYFNKPQTHRKIDLRLTHRVNEYMGCMVFVRAMNRLLRAYQEDYRYHLIMNGVFIYNFHKDIEGRRKPRQFLAEYLKRGSRLHIGFERLWEHLRSRWFPNHSVEGW